MIPVRCLHILYIKHLLPETCKNLFFTALRHQQWPCRFSCIKQFKFLVVLWSVWNANLSSIAVLYLGWAFPCCDLSLWQSFQMKAINWDQKIEPKLLQKQTNEPSSHLHVCRTDLLMYMISTYCANCARLLIHWVGYLQ